MRNTTYVAAGISIVEKAAGGTQSVSTPTPAMYSKQPSPCPTSDTTPYVAQLQVCPANGSAPMSPDHNCGISALLASSNRRDGPATRNASKVTSSGRRATAADVSVETVMGYCPSMGSTANPLRNRPGETPNTRLNARVNASCDSKPQSNARSTSCRSGSSHSLLAPRTSLRPRT